MNKHLKSILAHSGASMAIMAVLLLLPHAITALLAVILIFYSWDLSPWLGKDAENRGLRYWWNIANWGVHEQFKLFCAAAGAAVVFIIYLWITL